MSMENLIEQCSLFFRNPKCQAFGHFLWLCRPVCVGSGRKPRRQGFSYRDLFLVSDCPPGYTKNETSGNCYLYSLIRKSWHNARQTCLEQYGDLVVLNDENKLDNFTDLARLKGFFFTVCNVV